MKNLKADQNWFETIRTQAEQITANNPYRQNGETLAAYYDWMVAHAGANGQVEAIRFAQKRYAETL